MKIDICFVVFNNYSLLEYQLKHFNNISGDFRLLVLDNSYVKEDIRKYTPRSLNYPITFLEASNWGFDGLSHGNSLDTLVQAANTDLICIQDSDFFWLDPNILEEVENLYIEGYQCIGCEGFYRDFQSNIDTRWPDRAGALAPVCWGMFVDRKLAASETFVCTHLEGSEIKEVGWRLREKLIKTNIKRYMYKGYEDPNDFNLCYFKDNETVKGVHLLKGSGARSSLTNKIPEVLTNYGF